MRTAIFAAGLVLGGLAASPADAQVLVVKIGTIIAMGTNFCPFQWERADGRLVSISDYGQLFQVIGTTYGGDGKTNFALPDFKGGTYGRAAQPLTWCVAVYGDMPTAMNKPTKHP